MSRRKFGVLGLVSSASKPRVDKVAFKTVVSKSLRTRFLGDLANKRLYFSGQLDNTTFESSIQEVVALFLEVPVRQVEQACSRHVWGIPLFYSLDYSQCNGQIKSVGPKTAKELMTGYEDCERRHKAVEFHHPDSPFFCTTIRNSIECVIDVFSSLLRNSSLVVSYSRLLAILLTEKFSRLSPLGVYYALMHIAIRGVANSDLLRLSSQWRYCDSAKLEELNLQYMKGLVEERQIASYRRETWLHAVSVRQELLRMRFPSPNHDYSKFWNSMVWYYSWRWGVYEQMSMVQRHRTMSGCDVTSGFPTMKSVGRVLSSSIVSGLNKSTPTIQEQVDYAVDRFSTSFESCCLRLSDKLVDESAHVVDEKLTKLTEDLKGVISDVFKGASQLKSEVIDGLQSRFDPFMRSAISSMDEISQLLTLMTGQISSVVEKATSFLFNPLGLDNIKLDLSSILEAFKYLIFYINVDSKILKTMCFIQILRHLGVLEYAFKYVKSIWKYLVEDEEVDTPPASTNPFDVPGEPTFDSATLMTLLTSPFRLVKYIVLVLVSVAKGSPLSSIQIGSLLKHTAAMMRNFHFIGGGILGIERICRTIKDLYVKVSEWVMENIFGKSSEKTLLAKRLSKWILLIRYFSTEAGMTAIRANSKVLKRAELLFAEGQALLHELSEPSPLADKFLLSQLQRYWRNSQQLASMIHRIRAASTFEPPMFHVQFVGEAGIGKSHQMERFVKDLLQNVWTKDEVNSFWAYNPDCEYFDGYAGQKIMMIDDLFRFNEPKHLTSLIGLVTSVPIILPMANLEDKGLQMTSSILVSSTNTPYPVGKDIYCMEAVYRRRHLLVHVTTDRRVLNAQSKSFDKTLFKEFYPGQNSEEFPHLRYHLLKPVPVSADQMEVVVEPNDYFPNLVMEMDLLEGANNVIRSGERLVDPKFFFVNERPPSPLPVPCENWTYDQFLTNVKLRYDAFRGTQDSLTRVEKFGHVESCLAEIDRLYDQVDMLDPMDIELLTVNLKKGGIVELPPVKMLEAYFTDMVHPYGASDPLSSRVFEGEQVAPELDSVDFDEVAAEVMETVEGEPTGMTLTEEMERAARIRAKRKPVCGPMHGRLRSRFAQGKRAIVFHPSFTRWDPAVVSHEFGDKRAARCHEYFKAPNSLMSYVVEVADSFVDSRPDPRPFMPLRNDYYKWFYSNLFSTALSAIAVVPSSPAFPREQWGRPTGIPMWFLHRLYRVENDVNWYLDIDDSPVEPLGRELVQLNGEDFRVNADVPYFFSMFGTYHYVTMEFDTLTVDQQIALVEDAQWRYQYSGYFTIQAVREQMKGTWKEIPMAVLDYVSRPVAWLFRNCAKYSSFIIPIIMLALLYGIFYGIARLLIPARPTSKYLHRGPPSGVVYSGNLTSLVQNRDSTATLASSLLKRNVRGIQICLTDEVRSAQALASSQFLFLNKHCVENIVEDEFVVVMDVASQDEPLEFLIRKSDLKIDPDNDLAVIYSRLFPMARDVSSFLLSDEEFQSAEMGGELYFLARDGREIYIERQMGFRRYKTPCRMITSRGKIYSMARAAVVQGSTHVGRSGSPVLMPSQRSGRCLLGIQAWQLKPSHGEEISIQVITSEMYSSLTGSFESFLKEDYESDFVENETGIFTNDSVPICGDFPPVGYVGSSQIKRSPISTFMDISGVSSDRVPAALSPYDSRLLSSLHPLKYSLGKYFRGKIKLFDQKFLDLMLEEVPSWLLSRLDSSSFRILNFRQIISGTGEDGSNPMNLSSSPGIPYIYNRMGRGKRPYFEIEPDGTVVIHDTTVQIDMLALEGSLAERKIPLSCSYDFPKDELRPVVKALGSLEEPPKTRTVTCMNMLWTLVWRKYTLDFWSSVHRAADGTFPLCPGMNPEGPDWTRAWDYLNLHPNAVDLDVSNWDGFLPPQLFYLAIEIICKALSYSLGSKEYNILVGISIEVMNSYVKYGSVIYQKFRGMISGFPGTAEMNTFVHFLLLFYIYLRLAPSNYRSLRLFNLNVSKLLYGDDVIFTFSDEISPWFNGITVFAEYQRIGYPVTPASKTGVAEFSKPLSSCVFLKSSWNHYSPIMKLRKMDLCVARDLLYWERAKEHPIDQFYSNCYDACWIVFGHGQIVFSKFLLKLNAWLRQAKLPTIDLSYREMFNDYISRYYM